MPLKDSSMHLLPVTPLFLMSNKDTIITFEFDISLTFIWEENKKEHLVPESGWKEDKKCIGSLVIMLLTVFQNSKHVLSIFSLSVN